MMRKLSAVLAIILLVSPVIAHADHSDSTDTVQNKSDIENPQQQSQTGFSQLYPGYRSGTLWVIAEIVVVLGAAGLASRHYYRKSESSSLKEFIREELL